MRLRSRSANVAMSLYAGKTSIQPIRDGVCRRVLAHAGAGRTVMNELRRASRAMRTARPAFIVGEARSGTSLLYRTLQKHPSFRPHTTNLVETDIFSHLRRTFMFGRSYPDTLIRFMLNDEAQWAAFLRSIRPLKVVSAALIPINYALRHRMPLWLWHANLNALALRAYFFHAWRARGCARLLEKTPTNTPNLPGLAAAFPGAQFLYIHRHPIDVFTSYRRRAAVDPQATWAVQSLDQFCRTYEASTRRALAWREANSGRLHCVRYEALTQDPATTFREVCDFLGEPFVPEALDEQNPDPARWPVDPHLWGGIVSRTKRWEDYLQREEALELQSRLAAIMRRLEYAPYVVAT
jgi:hypothetical protein